MPETDPTLSHSDTSAQRYRTIVADPPWRYTRDVGALRASRGNEPDGRGAQAEDHYATLMTEEIAALPVSAIAAPEAHLYLWVTNPLLTDQRPDIKGRLTAPDICRAWGFEPKAMLTWLKGENGGGMGWYFRGDTEHVLFAVRGKLGIPAGQRVSNVFRGRRGPHSAKPDSFYDIVEAISPGPYAELFARRARFGWDYPIGDQALGGVAA